MHPLDVVAYLAERARSKWQHYLWLVGMHCTRLP